MCEAVLADPKPGLAIGAARFSAGEVLIGIVADDPTILPYGNRDLIRDSMPFAIAKYCQAGFTHTLNMVKSQVESSTPFR
jgi:hypothetical protein